MFRQTVGGIKASVEQNRTEPSRHQAVSQAACDVTAALKRSIAVSAAQAYRRENEAFLQQSVGWGRLWEGSYWITEYPSRTVVKAMDTNGEAG